MILIDVAFLQSLHNDYAVTHSIKGGTIKKFSFYDGWKGYFDPKLGCIYDKTSGWNPKYDRSIPDFPLDLAHDFDKKYKTHIMFLTDDEFTDKTWRQIQKLDENACKVFAHYFWRKYVLRQLISNRAGFCKISLAKEIKVKF